MDSSSVSVRANSPLLSLTVCALPQPSNKLEWCCAGSTKIIHQELRFLTIRKPGHHKDIDAGFVDCNVGVQKPDSQQSADCWHTGLGVQHISSFKHGRSTIVLVAGSSCIILDEPSPRLQAGRPHIMSSNWECITTAFTTEIFHEGGENWSSPT